MYLINVITIHWRIYKGRQLELWLQSVPWLLVWTVFMRVLEEKLVKVRLIKISTNAACCIKIMHEYMDIMYIYIQYTVGWLSRVKIKDKEFQRFNEHLPNLENIYPWNCKIKYIVLLLVILKKLVTDFSELWVKFYIFVNT